LKPFVILLQCIVFAGILFPAEGNIKNRVIYLIHGDGDYLFHENGKSYYSDEEVLSQALDNARSGVNSEYFIFHLKPKRTFLIFFPGEESDFYHYRNGQLVKSTKYFRYDLFEGHSAEWNLINENAWKDHVENNIILYYGHEIPLEEEYGYNASFPEVPVGLTSLMGRITEILDALNEKKYDLFVLSTCNNGSPGFIFPLAGIADFIIASPGDLHLSQLNSKYLQQLEDRASTLINAFALQFASSAFEILRTKTLTEVAISVYNSKELLNKYNPDSVCPGNSAENEAVRVFFRPSRFGVNKDRLIHSGWNCSGQNIVSGRVE
jgi:hypothetical protein